MFDNEFVARQVNLISTLFIYCLPQGQRLILYLSQVDHISFTNPWLHAGCRHQHNHNEYGRFGELWAMLTK
jgi:hypothetical protein